MAKFSGADAFIFKPYFPGIPWPEWDRPVDIEIELVPHFPGIPEPLFATLKTAEVADVKQVQEMDEIGAMADLGLFG